ncbi:MAG: glycosyltransferase family 2 protein [Xanthomonadaceae bacterium]|nr:glycosyltransferase family 2 protein [Xanthomonadaceae bacterium]
MIPITVTVIAKNEEKNIGKTLAAVQGWAEEIIVVDSGSADKTMDIAKTYGATTLEHQWLGYGQQKNYAQSQAKNEWVLNLDADEVITSELKEEISTVLKTADSKNISGFAISRRSYYVGKWIKNGGWFPSRVVRLAKKSSSKWSEPAVHEVLEVNGNVENLNSPLDHFTFPTIESQILTNLRYAKQGSIQLLKSNSSHGVFIMLMKAWWKFFNTYIFQLGFLDGKRGLIISINAAHSLFMKYAFTIETTEWNKK